LICATGAFTQAPRHSTSTHDSLPSALTWSGAPIVSWQSLISLSAPRSTHGVVPQSWTWNWPTGARLNIV